MYVYIYIHTHTLTHHPTETLVECSGLLFIILGGFMLRIWSSYFAEATGPFYSQIAGSWVVQ